VNVLAALLAALQAGTWTVSPVAPSVGDTVVIWRAFPGATSVRVRPLAGTATIEPLADPSSLPARGGVVVRYAVAAFAPGAHALAMPDLDVLHPDGVAETVPGDTARVTVVSVLPPGDSLPAPQPSLGPLPRAAPRLLPLGLLIAAALGSGVTWLSLRRRRGARPGRVPPVEKRSPAPIARWMAAGEARAVAAVAAERLRRAIARVEPRAHAALDDVECLALLGELRPAWPLDELRETLSGLERARYAPAIPADVLAVAEQAEEMATALERAE